MYLLYYWINKNACNFLFILHNYDRDIGVAVVMKMIIICLMLV